MGRMLETLKLGGGKGPAQECVVDWSMRDAEEIPYIEVGAGKKVEGSAQVMAVAVKHPAQSSVQPPHPPTEKTLAAAPAPQVVYLTEAKPMTVAYEPWPGAPTPFAQLPARGMAPEIIAFHQPDHAISKQYAALFDKIAQGQTGAGTKALLFCGARAQVGTTTVLLNLGVVAAQGKRRLALIDAHLARPSLAQRLGLTVGAGLQEILAGTCALEQALLQTGVAGLHLVAARADDKAAVGHLGVEATVWLLAWLKERFDIVLVDGPGVDEAADCATLAPLADGIYIVLPQSDTSQPPKALAQAVSHHGGRLKGIIHTHFEV